MKEHVIATTVSRDGWTVTLRKVIPGRMKAYYTVSLKAPWGTTLIDHLSLTQWNDCVSMAEEAESALRGLVGD